MTGGMRVFLVTQSKGNVSVWNNVEPDLRETIQFEASCLLAELRKRGCISFMQEDVIMVRRCFVLHVYRMSRMKAACT